MNLETLIAYIVGLLSTLVCAIAFYCLGWAHGLAEKRGKQEEETRDE